MTVAYDGTAFRGWQVQPAQRTVQGALEDAMRVVLGEGDLRVTGAGRTDAGVHARGQVASFASATRLPARAVAAQTARRLPDDVRIEDLREVPSGFHARHSARARRYAYRLLHRDDVLWSRFAWRPALRWDAAGLDRATRVLEGTHDFRAFQSAGSSDGRPICRMYRARWSGWEAGLRLDILADHFLYHMVRNIVGTALRLSLAPDPARAMREVLESRSRARAGLNAPACGLCFEQAFYDEEGAA